MYNSSTNHKKPKKNQTESQYSILNLVNCWNHKHSAQCLFYLGWWIIHRAYMRQYTNHHLFRYWLDAWPVLSHYLNQCWNIVNWDLGNKLQWNLSRNLCIFIKENAFENVFWKMLAVLSQPSGKCRPFCLGLNVLSIITTLMENLQGKLT